MSEQNALIDADDNRKEEDNIFFNLMKRVGTLGKYQVICFTIWGLISFCSGGILLITAFIFYQDPYQCNKPFPGDSCEKYVCSLAPQARKQFIPEPYIYSLANKFDDYRCESQMQYLTLIKTVMYGGNLVGIIVMALFGGIIGKRQLILLNLLVDIIGLMVTIFSVNLLMGGIGLFLCTFGAMINLQVCFTYAIETVSDKYRQAAATALSAVFSLGALFNVLWFYILPDFQLVLGIFYGVPTIIMTAAFIFFIKDAPICMVTRLSPEKAFKDLQKIAQINDKQDFNLTVQQMQSIQLAYKSKMFKESDKKVFSIIDLFRYKSLRMMTVILAIVDVTSDLIYFAPSLMIDQFNFNIYINGLVVQTGQFISGAISIYMITYAPRRLLAIVSFSIVMACSIALIFLWDQNQEKVTDISSNILVLVLIFVIQFALTAQFNCFTVYVNELYPTQIRVVSLGFIKVFGAIVILLESEIINASLSSGFKIMILFALLSALSIICSWVLPETFGKQPPDVIKELRERHSEDDLQKSILSEHKE